MLIIFKPQEKSVRGNQWEEEVFMVDEKGVSEVIGAILLVSLVILGAMIVAVLFLSQPPPQEIPQVNAIAGNETDPDSGVEYIYLLHDGGDPLMPMETVIRIDGGRDPGTIEISTEDGSYELWTSGEWSVGKTLRITDDQPPQSVTLVYSGGSSQALLLTSTFVEMGSGGGGGGPEPPQKYTITPLVVGNGAIGPGTVQTVDSGATPTFIFIPDEGYRLDGVTVDGDPVTPTGKSYTFPPVTDNHTIVATFVEESGGCDDIVADFMATPLSGDIPLTVSFTDTSTGDPTNWYWTFGDGDSSALQNPVHTYYTVGDYTVSLNPSKDEPGCSRYDIETKTDYIHATCPEVSAAFTASLTTGEVPLTVQFTDQSTGNPTSWSWAFGDGDTSNEQDPKHEYTSVGPFTVTLTATNDCGNSETLIKTDYISTTCSSSEDDAERVYPRCGSCQVLPNGSCQVSLGYLNNNAYCAYISVFYPVGSAKNEFTGPIKDRGQPENFNPGLNLTAFTIVFDENNLKWKLGGTGPSYELDLSCKNEVCTCTDP